MSKKTRKLLKQALRDIRNLRLELIEHREEEVLSLDQIGAGLVEIHEILETRVAAPEEKPDKLDESAELHAEIMGRVSYRESDGVSEASDSNRIIDLKITPSKRKQGVANGQLISNIALLAHKMSGEVIHQDFEGMQIIMPLANLKEFRERLRQTLAA